jgi:hypothetical protein
MMHIDSQSIHRVMRRMQTIEAIGDHSSHAPLFVFFSQSFFHHGRHTCLLFAVSILIIIRSITTIIMVIVVIIIEKTIDGNRNYFASIHSFIHPSIHPSILSVIRLFVDLCSIAIVYRESLIHRIILVM